MSFPTFSREQAADYAYLRRLVLENSAIVLDPTKDYLIANRITPIAERQGFPSLSALVEQLKSGGNDELQALVVEAMTTNETSFFRDAPVYQSLATHILPTLVAQRAAKKSLRIWSAACSSGQEPYSVAMLLEDTLEDAEEWNVSIIASDLSREMVERTRRGWYSDLDVSRGVPADFIERFFVPDGRGYRVRDQLKRWIEPQVMNLIEPWPRMGRFDLILMRNVLIYFDVSTKRHVLDACSDMLREDGFLLLGTQETLLGVTSRLTQYEDGGSCCFRPCPKP